MNIKEYLEKNILLCDGGMGTYYSEVTQNDIEFCEVGNITNKDIVIKIHKEYIKSGAKLIRTNTFSANTFALQKDRKEIEEIILSGINISKEASKDEDIYIAGSIGPIRVSSIENESSIILDEYKFIIDIFLKNGINIFIFETFSSEKYLKEISKYIKEKDNTSFIIASFAIIPDGFSRNGVKALKIFENAQKIQEIDVLGLNCGSGPTATINNLKVLIKDYNIKSVMPNAGYPMLVNERTVFTNNPTYFASKVAGIRSLGVSILGGCCGTSPKHIKALSKELFKNIDYRSIEINIEEKKEKKEKVKNDFIDKLNNNEFVTAIELSAPTNTDIYELIEGAKLCKKHGISLVTIPDSPMSRVRADSITIASKIKREVNIETMPHICCRDKNTNALRSSILGAHIENIRNILVITGDPISDAKSSETKSVFNLNSFKLMNLINESNNELYKDEEISIGGALNLNVLNKESEYNRMLKKVENGAKFFLTQPIYEDKAIEFLKEIKKRRSDIKILGGILPIVTYKNAMFLNNELPGVSIPESIINRFSVDMTKEEGENIGIEIATEIGRKLKGICDGLYFITPFKRVSMLIKIIENINN